MEAGTYIVGKIRLEEGHTTFFGKVTEINKGIVYGRKEKDAHIKPEYFEIPKTDVLLDLGPAPHPGTVYGHVVTSRLTANRQHDFFGPIAWFYKPKKEVAQKLDEAMDYTAKLLLKHKLPPPSNTHFEIRSKDVKAKWAGYYKHSNAVKKSPHRISFRPESVPLTSKSLAYVLAHEYAHWFHYNCVTGDKINAKWVRLFNTSIKVQKITKEDSLSLLDRLIKSGECPSDFRSSLDENERNQFNWIFRNIKADHALNIKEIDLLFKAEYFDDIRAVWPQRTLNKKDLKPVISEYATTNFHETFAEAFAFHVTGVKLPEAVTALVQKSIEYGRAKGDSGDV